MNNNKFFGPVSGLYQDAINNANRRFEQIVKDNDLTIDKLLNPLKYMRPLEVLDTFIGSASYDLLSGITTSVSGALSAGIQIFVDLYADVSRIVNAPDANQMKDAFGDAFLRVGNNALTFVGSTIAGGLGIGLEVLTLGQADTSFAQKYVKNLSVLNRQYTYYSTNGIPNPNANNTPFYTGNVLFDAAMMDEDNPILKDAYNQEERYAKAYESRSESIEATIKMSLNFKKQFDTAVEDGILATLGLKDKKELANTIFGDNVFYQQFSGVLNSIGAILAAKAFAKISYNTGFVTAQQSAQLASAYFGAQVFGNAFEKAIDDGASISDAYMFAYSNALIETAIENIGGIKLGVSQAVVPTTFQAFLRNGFEEGIEEVLSEFFTPGFDMYRGQTAIERDGEFPRLSEKDLFQRMFFAFSAGAISGGFFGATNQFLFNNTIEGRAFILRDAFKQDLKSVGKEKALKRLKLRIRQFINTLNSPSAQGVKLNKQGRAVLGTLTVAEKLQYVKNAGLGKIIDTEVARFDRLGKASETFDETKIDELLNDGYFSFRIRPDVILDETVFQPLYEGKRVKVEDYAANQAVQGENLNNRNVGESSKLPFRLTKSSELNPLGKFAFETVSKSNVPMAVVSSKNGDTATFAFYLNGVIFLNQDSNATPDQMRAEIRKHELIHLIAKKLPMMYEEILKEIQKIVSIEELVAFDPAIGFFINEKANIAKDFIATLKEGKFLEHLNFALQDILETFGGNEKIRELNVIVKDKNRPAELRQQAANRLRIITESIAARMSEEVVAYFVEMMVKDSKALTRVIEKQEPGLRSIFTQLAEVVRDFFEEKQFERVFRRAFPGAEEGVVSFETKEGEKRGVQFVGESRKIIKSIERKITEATKQIIETRSQLEYFYRDFFPTRETAAKFVNPTILKKYGNDLDLIFDSLSKAIELDPFTKVFSIKGDQYNIRDVFLGDFSAPANKTSPQKSGLEKFTENWRIDDGKVSKEIKGITDIFIDKISVTLDALLNELQTNMIITEEEKSNALTEISEIFSIKEKNPFYYANVLNLYFNYLEGEINALTAKMGDISEEDLEKSRQRLLAVKNRQSIVAIMRHEMEVLSLASVFSLSNGLSSYLTQNSIFSKDYEVMSFLKNFNVFVSPADSKQLYLPTIISTQVLGENFLVSSEDDVFLSQGKWGSLAIFNSYASGDISLFSEIIKKSNVLSQRASTGKEITLSVDLKRNILIAAEYSVINLQKNIAKKNIKLTTSVIENNLPTTVLQKPSQFSNLKKATHGAISRIVTFISGNMDKLPDFMQNIAMTNSGYITKDIKNPGGLLMEFNIEKELNDLAKPEDKNNFADIKRRATEVFIHTFLEGMHINPSNNKKTYFGLDNYKYEVEIEYREETRGKKLVSSPVGISIYIYPTEKTINQYIKKLEEKAVQAGTQTGTNFIDSTKFGFINMQTITEDKVARDEFKNVINVITENVFPEIVKIQGSQPIIIRGTTTSIQDYVKQSNAKEGDFFVITTAPYETGNHIDNITSGENLLLTGFKVKLIDFNELLAQQVLVDEAKQRGDQKFGLYVIKVFDVLSLPNGQINFYSPSKKQFIHELKNNLLVLNNEEQKLFQAISRKLSFFEINTFSLDDASRTGASTFVEQLQEHNKESSINPAIFAFYMYHYLSKKFFDNNLIHNVEHFNSILSSLFKPGSKPLDVVSEAVLSQIDLKTQQYIDFSSFNIYALQAFTKYISPPASFFSSLELEKNNYFYNPKVANTILEDFQKVIVSKDSKILGLNLDKHLKEIGGLNEKDKQTLIFNHQDFLDSVESAKKDLKTIFDFDSPIIEKVLPENKFYLNIERSLEHILSDFTDQKAYNLEGVEENLYEEVGIITRIVEGAKDRETFEGVDFVDAFDKAIKEWLSLRSDGGLSVSALADSIAGDIPSVIDAIRYYLEKFPSVENQTKDSIEKILQDGSKGGIFGLAYIFTSFYNLDVFNTVFRKGKSKLTSKLLKMNPSASVMMTNNVVSFYYSLTKVITGKPLSYSLLFYPNEKISAIIHYLYLNSNPDNKSKDFSTNVLEYYYQKGIIDTSFNELYELQKNIIINAIDSIEIIKKYGSLENGFAAGVKLTKKAQQLKNGSGILSAMLDVFGVNQVKLSDKDFIIKPANYKMGQDGMVTIKKNNSMPIFFGGWKRNSEQGFGFTDQDTLNLLEDLANKISKITPFNTKTDYSAQEIPSINLIDYSTTLNIGALNFDSFYKPKILNISKEGELYAQNLDSNQRFLNGNQVQAYKDIHPALRNDEGRIKSYWHGTGISFNEFSFSFMHKKFGATGQAYGPGFYFAQDRNYSENYMGSSNILSRTAGGDVKRVSATEADLLKEVYLIIKKPLMFVDRNEAETTFFTPNEFTSIIEVLFKNKLKDGFIPELAKKMMFEHHNDFLLQQKVYGIVKTHSVEEPWTPSMLAEMLIKYSNGIAEEDQFDPTERKILVPGIVMATMIRKWRTYVFANYLIGKKFDDGKGSKIDDFEKEIDKAIVKNNVETVRGHFRFSYGYRHEMLIEELMETYEQNEDIIFRNLNGVAIREVLESVTEATGYDGIVNETDREGHIVVAFSPKQVKSVDNTSPDANSAEIFDFNTDKKSQEIQKTINDLAFNEKNVAYVQPPVNSNDVQKFIEQAFRASPVVVSVLPATWIASEELQSLIEEDKKLIYIERLSKPVFMNPNKGSEERISTNAAIMVWVDKSDTRFAQYENLRIVKENKKRYATEDFVYRLLRNRNAEEDAKTLKKFTDENGNIDFDFAVPFRGDGVNYNQKITQDPNNKKTTSIPANGKYIIIKAGSPQALAILNKINFYNLAKNGNQLRGLGFSAEQLVEEYNRIKQDETDPFEPLDNGEVVFKRASKKNQTPKQPKITKEEIKETFGNESVFREFVTFDENGNMVIKADDIRNAKAPNNEININGKVFSSRIYAVNVPYNNMGPLLVDKKYEKISKISELDPRAMFVYKFLLNEKIPFAFFSGTSKRAYLGVSYGQRVVLINSEKGKNEFLDTLIHETTHELFKHEPKLLDSYAHELAMMLFAVDKTTNQIELSEAGQLFFSLTSWGKGTTALTAPQSAGFNAWVDYMTGERAYKDFKKYININDLFYILRTPNTVLKADPDGAKKLEAKNETLAQLSGFMFSDEALFKDMFNKSDNSVRLLMANVYSEMISNPNLSKNVKMYLKLSFEEYKETMRGYFKGIEALYPTQRLYTISSINDFISSFTKGLFTTKKQLIEKYTRERLNKKRGQATVVLDKLIFLASLLEKTAQAGTEFYKELKQDFTNLQTSALYLLNLENDSLTKLSDIKVFARLAKVRAEAKKIANGVEKGTILIDRKGAATAANTVIFTSAQDQQDKDYEIEEFFSNVLEALYDVAETYNETPEQIQKMFGMKDNVAFQIDVANVVDLAQKIQDSFDKTGIINPSRFVFLSRLSNALQEVLDVARPYAELIDMLRKENFDASKPSPEQVQAGIISLRTKLEQSNIEILSMKFKQKINNAMNTMLTARLQKESPVGEAIQKLDVILKDMNSLINNDKLTSKEIGSLLLEEIKKVFALAQSTFLANISGVTDADAIKGLDKRWERFLDYTQIAMFQASLMARDVKLLEKTHLNAVPEVLNQLISMFGKDEFNPGQFAGGVAGMIDAFAKRYISTFAEDDKLTNDEYVAKLKKAMFDFMKGNPSFNNEILKLWQTMTPQDFLGALVDKFKDTGIDIFEKVYNLYLEATSRAENIAAEFHREYLDFIKKNKGIQEYSYETIVPINEDFLVNVPSGVFRVLTDEIEKETTAVKEAIELLKEDLDNLKEQRNQLAIAKKDLQEKKKQLRRGSLAWIDLNDKQRKITAKKAQLLIEIKNKKTVIDSEKESISKENLEQRLKAKILEYLATNPLDQEKQKLNKGAVIALYLSVKREVEMMEIYEQAKELQEFTLVKPTNHFKFLNQVNILDNELLRKKGYEVSLNSMLPFTILTTDKKVLLEYLESLLDDQRDQIILDFMKKMFDRNYELLNEEYSKRFFEDLFRQTTYIPFTTPYSSYERDIKLALSGRYNLGVPDGLVAETTIGAQTFLKIENIFAILENHARSTAKYSYERFLTDWQNIIVNKATDKTTLTDIFSGTGGNLLGKNNPFLRFFNQMMVDVLAYSDLNETDIEKFMKQILRIYRGRILFLNVGSILRQFGSIATILIKSRGWNKPISIKDYIMNFTKIFGYRIKYLNFLMNRSGNFYFRVLFSNIPDLAKSIDTSLGIRAQNAIEKIIEFGAKPAGRADSDILVAAFKTMVDAIRQENTNLTEEEAMELAVVPFERSVMLYGVANTNKAYRSHFSNSKTFFGQYSSKFQSENVLQWSAILRYWWELKNGIQGADRELLLSILSLFMSAIYGGLVGGAITSVMGYYNAEDDVAFELVFNEILWSGLIGSFPIVNLFTSLIQFDKQTIIRQGFEPTLPGFGEISQVVNLLSTGLFYKDTGDLNFRKVLRLFGEILAPLGIPLKNIERLVRLIFGIGSGLGLDFAREGMQWFMGQTDAQALTEAIKRGDKGAIEYFIEQTFENTVVQKEMLRLALSDKNIRFSFKNDTSFVVTDSKGNRKTFRIQPSVRSFYTQSTNTALRRLFQSGRYKAFSNQEKAKVAQRIINYFWNYMRDEVSDNRKRFSNADIGELVARAIEYERKN